jgi:hypothetical protein
VDIVQPQHRDLRLLILRIAVDRIEFGSPFEALKGFRIISALLLLPANVHGIGKFLVVNTKALQDSGELIHSQEEREDSRNPAGQFKQSSSRFVLRSQARGLYNKTTQDE